MNYNIHMNLVQFENSFINEEEKNININLYEEFEGDEEKYEDTSIQKLIIEETLKNEFYSEAELKEKIEEELFNYTSEDFITTSFNRV